MSLPPRIVELIKQQPLEKPRQTAKVLAGDLAGAARAYANAAAYSGDEMAPWNVWLTIQRERGLELASAIEELPQQGRRWLGVAALANAQDEVGLLSYARYLEKPGEIGPFSGENLVFLDALVRAGRGEEALRWANELERRSDTSPVETIWATRYLLKAGEVASARERVNAVLARQGDWASAWAVSALVAFAEGDHLRASADAKKAARRQLSDEVLVGALREHLGAAYDELAQAAAVPHASHVELLEAFQRSPGQSLVPSAAQAPHWYAGDDFVMPLCAGCSHPIRQWFLLDLTVIPELAPKLPAWPRCPLLGCVDCMVWMGRHDYVVDHTARRITLRNVAISTHEFGKAHGTTPPLERRYATLVATDPTDSPYDVNFPPLVGGSPLWVQDVERALCPDCDEPMVYVAAMATPYNFEPPFFINNEGGFQYHFACNACGTLSVIAQWS